MVLPSEMSRYTSTWGGMVAPNLSEVEKVLDFIFLAMGRNCQPDNLFRQGSFQVCFQRSCVWLSPLRCPRSLLHIEDIDCQLVMPGNGSGTKNIQSGNC